MTLRPPMLDEAPVSSVFTALGMPLNLVVCPCRPMSSSPFSRPRAVVLRSCERLPPAGLCRPLRFLDPGQWISDLVRGCPPAGLCRPLRLLDPGKWLSDLVRGYPLRSMSSTLSSRPRAVALRPCERLPPPAFVVLSVFSTPSSDSPTL